MRFEWDDAKEASNLRKHGVDFSTAQVVFEDPWQLPRQDREVDGEVRWQTLGMVGEVLLLVAHTVEEDDEEIVRIISARKAEPHERRAYESSFDQGSRKSIY